jgi:glutamine amidotransferase-like uncharacterized protein
MSMRFFPASAKNVLRRIVVTTSLFVAPTIFTACGSPGSPMGNPNKQVAPTVDQISAPSSSGSGSTNTLTTPPVLLFNGTGTDDDVAAVESVLSTLKLSYATANSSQLNAMSQTRLRAYKLLIVPGGNSITIGNNLSKTATAMVRSTVQNYGLHYLGICAGGFFGSYQNANGLDLTSGVWFNVWPNFGKGTGKEAVNISFPNGSKLNVYWHDGPETSGWGHIVAKYPDGTAAITEGAYGKGFAIMSGVHPEAPAGWRTCCTFTTPLATDLAYARTLVTAALNGTLLPHY